MTIHWQAAVRSVITGSWGQGGKSEIKQDRTGTAETMLQCFYARAMRQQKSENKFRDTKAEELIDRIDYDFSNAKKRTQQ